MESWITEIEFRYYLVKIWEKNKGLGRGLYSLKMQTFYYFSFAIKGINPFQFPVKAYIAISFLKIYTGRKLADFGFFFSAFATLLGFLKVGFIWRQNILKKVKRLLKKAC